MHGFRVGAFGWRRKLSCRICPYGMLRKGRCPFDTLSGTGRLRINSGGGSEPPRPSRRRYVA